MIPSLTFNHVIEGIFKSRQTQDISGKSHVVNDMVARTEARILYNMAVKAQAKTTIEVGLAYGVSALAFCQAHDDLGTNGKHYAVDPNQSTTYNSAAIAANRKAGFEKYLEVIEKPSHMGLPGLIEQGIKVDAAFIDGWHTFDYTLIDFYLIDKLLKPGGYVAFHDVYGRSKQKVINFILTHRKYQIAHELMQFDGEPRAHTLKFFLWRMYKDPGLLFSWYHWQYQLRNSSGLIVLKKLEDFEPPYDFFKNF
ncbi:MAG TPA: class I SAM-dependent methyltransferase [Chitinophagaceae bacterium]|nr:class I SAM-dependent methyltransferase [Chitinophagaceae bacterium]